MVLALHLLPVSAEVAAPETMNTLFLSAVIWLVASATPEFGTSTTRSTLSTSYHFVTSEEPTSGLFWWSALTSSTFRFGLILAKSSMASFAAALEPGPARSAYRLDMSLMTAILTVCVPDWATAATPAPHSSAAATSGRPRMDLFI